MAQSSDAPEGRRPHFFKVFSLCYTSKRLGIPPGFWKHIKHETSGGVSLTGPSGNVWNVDLVRDNDTGISFQKGWEVFVSDHNLKTGDFLLFRYDGDLSFTVLVFDPTACEKEDTFDVMPCEGVMILGESRGMRCPTECSVEDLITLTPQTDMALPLKSAGGRENPLVATCRGFAKKNVISVLESHSEGGPDANDGSRVTNEDNKAAQEGEQDSLVPQVGPLTLLHNLRPDIVANTNERCVCASMDNCELHSRLTPGHSLFKEALSSNSCPPWKQSSECHFDQVVCKVKEEPQSDQDINTAYFGESMEKKARITKSEVDKSRKVHGGNFKESSQKHKKLTVENSTHKKKKSATKQPHLWIKVRTGHAMSHRRPITEYEKAKTLEAALLFQSENPFGICVMRDSYVYYGFYLCLPRSFSKHLPKASIKMLLLDPSNQPWDVMYVYYKGRGGLSAGWGKFARVHKLESDDVCIFELSKPYEVRVHIFRVVDESI
uniref:B3 domain-containing protein Os11g0197600 n=1 Tax=Anthurium amnicola TaxID=1678845 RepID=A0A1D1ZEQ8_9ARAE